MREIGIRELKAGLSGVLRRVSDGEQIRVTKRGRPIAEIVPAGSRSGDARMRELVADGRVSPATRSRPSRAHPPLKSGRSASAVILAEREEDR